ncbi:bifunctional nicotinamidase/pyrazinamidase [Compostibacter hankyongensis]|uniref:nicotinamidase n=1 Tax=Compostibacter hankyongensis TaxID=1007089 RepID=A0ABP8FG41_9BACT
MKALLLIDIQYDFLPGGALEVPGGDRIIPVVNRLQPLFDLVVATQDWHPPDHKSFARNHPGKKVFEQVELEGLPQVLWPAHCVQETQGAEISAEISQHHIAAVFRKGMDPAIDSYSGFYDNGHRRSTGLAAYLQGMQVHEIYLAGLAADICVFFTALDSLAAGFDTVIIEDAAQALKEEDYKKAMQRFRDAGGRLLRSTQL